MAAYLFLIGDKCLKVGKAGPKSNARFSRQHYIPGSSRSNLAGSVLNNKERVRDLLAPELQSGVDDLDDRTISQWIKTHTTRVNLFLSTGIPNAKFVLNLLEAFLQCRLKPEFEGKTP